MHQHKSRSLRSAFGFLDLFRGGSRPPSYDAYPSTPSVAAPPPKPIEYKSVSPPAPFAGLMEKADSFLRLMRAPSHELRGLRVLIRMLPLDAVDPHPILIAVGPPIGIFRDLAPKIVRIEFTVPDYLALGPVRWLGVVLVRETGSLVSDHLFADPQPGFIGDTLKATITLEITENSVAKFLCEATTQKEAA